MRFCSGRLLLRPFLVEIQNEVSTEEGTLPKSQMIVDLHPDVARLTERWDRSHHFVDYRPFRANALKLKPGIQIPEGDNYRNDT